MDTKAYFKKAERYYATTTVETPIIVDRAEDIYIFDAENNSYLDLTSGIGVANIGYAQNDFIEAIFWHLISRGYANILHHDWHNKITLDFAERVVGKIENIFGDERKLIFTNSGTETTEAAIKLCFDQKKLKKPEEGIVVCFDGAFHGRSGYALPLMDPKKEVRIKHFPMAYKALRLPFPSAKVNLAKEINSAFKNKKIDLKNIVAAIIEPIEGEGGINLPDNDQLKELEKFCRSNGIPLIADEIQTGWGRTGKLLASEHFNLKPDIVLLGKGFGGGLPIGAAIFKKEMDFKEKGRHSSTFGGNALACAAANATLDIIEKNNLIEKAEKMGLILKKKLKELKKDFSPIIIEVRGKGLMWGVEFESPGIRNKIVEEGYRQGLVMMGCGLKTIRIMPPLIINEEQLNCALMRFKKAVSSVLAKEV